MRLVMVVSEFPKASEGFLVAKFLGLWKRGVDVHVVAEQESPATYALYPELQDDPSLQSRIHAWPARARPLALGWMALREIAFAVFRHPERFVAAFRAAVRHPVSEVPGRLLFALPLLRLGGDVLHFEFGDLAARRLDLVGWVAPRTTVSLRGFDANCFALDEPERLTRVFDVVDQVHCVSGDIRARAMRRGLPKETPCSVVTPAVDVARFPEPAERVAKARDGTLRIVSVGRLHWKKGYEFTLQALRIVADAGVSAQLRIVGGGPFDAAVRACVSDHGLTDCVTLLGEGSREQVRDELESADLFLHSAVSEGFCNAVLEAQAMGLPVVCSDADGLRENVEDGVTGFVVRRRDPEAIADAILRLARDTALRARMGAAGPPRVREHFSLERQIDAFVRFYEEALTES